MKRTVILFAGLLLVAPAAAQTLPKRFKLLLTQQEIYEIGKLADEAPFKNVAALESDIQAQINADLAEEKAATDKAAEDAMRAKIEKEKSGGTP